MPHIKQASAALLVAIALIATSCGSASSQTGDADASTDLTAPSLDAPVGDALLTEVATGGLVLSDGEVSPFVFTDFDIDVPAVFGITDNGQGVAVVVDLTTEEATGEILFGESDSEEDPTAATGVSVSGVEVDDLGLVGFSATGTIDIDGDATAFAMTLPIGLGTSTFELANNQAIVQGDLGARTYQQVSYLISNHPEVDTLVLTDISGSVNDEVNVETGRLVREAGYTTLVPANGAIFSGGVDLFTAGAQRIAEPGSEVGVHSWCCSESGETADQLTQDDPAHNDQLSYFTETLGDELGRAFYFFTLQAAPFNNTDDMTAAERDYFNVVTEDNTLADGTDQTATIQSILEGQSFDRPNDVGAAIVAAWTNGDAELVLTLQGEPATLVITTTGVNDDSVEGEVLTITLEPDDSAGWGVTEVTSNAICSRGVTEGLCA